MDHGGWNKSGDPGGYGKLPNYLAIYGQKVKELSRGLQVRVCAELSMRARSRVDALEVHEIWRTPELDQMGGAQWQNVRCAKTIKFHDAVSRTIHQKVLSLCRCYGAGYDVTSVISSHKMPFHIYPEHIYVRNATQ